jgi:hypothetical protein
MEDISMYFSIDREYKYFKDLNPGDVFTLNFDDNNNDLTVYGRQNSVFVRISCDIDAYSNAVRLNDGKLVKLPGLDEVCVMDGVFKYIPKKQ